MIQDKRVLVIGVETAARAALASCVREQGADCRLEASIEQLADDDLARWPDAVLVMVPENAAEAVRRLSPLRRSALIAQTPLLLIYPGPVERLPVDALLVAEVDDFLAWPDNGDQLPLRLALQIHLAEGRHRPANNWHWHRPLLDQLPDIAWVNRGGKIVYINPAGAEILGGGSADRILGRSPFDFIDPAFHQLVQGRVKAALESPQRFPIVQNRLVGENGERVDVEVIANSLEVQGQLDILVIARDVSPRLRAANALSEALERERAAVRKLAEGQRFLGMATRLGRLGAWAVGLPDRQMRWSDEVYAIHELKP